MEVLRAVSMNGSASSLPIHLASPEKLPNLANCVHFCMWFVHFRSVMGPIHPENINKLDIIQRSAAR